MHDSPHKRFGSRFEAGSELAKRLARFAGHHQAVVLALPKGGVEVGSSIAHELGLPFDVLVICSITTPACGETALGAITSGGVRMLNCAMIDRLHLDEAEIRKAVLRESIHLARRERVYRGELPSQDVADRTVILVDDGSTPCATLRNAIRLLRRRHADQVVVALPAACHHAACDLRLEADELVTLAEPALHAGTNQWFEHAPATRAAEVRRLLHSAFSGEDTETRN
jgi:predicted phosphoribosyltransferase